MGFFNFGNNSKAEIQSCALKISTGLGWKIQCKMPPKTKRFYPLVPK